MRPENILIDSGWETETVYSFCMNSQHRGIVKPSKGRFIGADRPAITDRQPKQGEQIGLNWRFATVQNRIGVRICTYDANYWKSIAHSKLSTHVDDNGALVLFGDEPRQHLEFAEQVTAETKTAVYSDLRGEVWVWKKLPSRENHWLDCVAGVCVAASMMGCRRPGDVDTNQRRHRMPMTHSAAGVQPSNRTEFSVRRPRVWK